MAKSSTTTLLTQRPTQVFSEQAVLLEEILQVEQAIVGMARQILA
jgi:hypothetical protein